MSVALGKASKWYGPGGGPWLVAALVAALLSVAVYMNGLGGEFVLDDHAFLVDNPQLTEPHDLSYFFAGDFWSYSRTPTSSAIYRPFYFAVLWLSNDLWPGSALALHLFSLSLHLAATLLLLAVIPRLLPGISPLAAGGGACLFAVHPVHVEPVAWISAFTHPMATALILASYLFHDHHQRRKNIYAFSTAGFFFLIALFTSEMATAYPFLILALDWVRHGRPRPLLAVPYFVLLAFYFVIRNVVLDESIPLSFSDPDAWLRFPVFLVEYLGHLILPYSQPLYLAMPSGWTISPASGFAAGSLAIMLAFLLTRRVRDRRGPLFAATWIFVCLLPPLAASFNPNPLFTLRSLYMPSVGIAILTAWLISTPDFVRQRACLTIFAFAAFLLLPLGLTIDANRDWLEDRRVYGRIITFNPAHYAGYLGLARHLVRTGETKEAVSQYEKAVALAGPRKKAAVLEALGLLFGQSGDPARSLEIYRQVTILEPNRSSAWVGIGNNLWYLGQLPEAADAYRKAHAADASNREACYNLVLVLRKLGKTGEAARYAACATILP
jgi:hypothetical protein